MRAPAVLPLVAATLVCATVLVGCARRQTAWTTLDAIDVPDGSDAFVLVDRTAMHLTHVEHDEHHLRGRVARAWLLPPAGVAAIADDSPTSTPTQIARSAGWPELRLAGRVVAVPHADIRSVRATVEVEPDAADDPSYGADNPPLLVSAAMSLVEYLIDPCCRSWCRDR